MTKILIGKLAISSGALVAGIVSGASVGSMIGSGSAILIGGIIGGVVAGSTCALAVFANEIDQ